MTESKVRSVRVEGVSVDLAMRSQEHMEELVRELQIIAIGMETDSATGEPPVRVAGLISELLERYAAVRSANREVLRGAADAGVGEVTLEMELPVDAAEDVRQLLVLLDRADRLCEEGALLTLASPPEVRQFRRRVAEQLLEQLDR